LGVRHAGLHRPFFHRRFVHRRAFIGAAFAAPFFIGAAYSSCWRWDPYYGEYVNVCYSPYYAYGGYW
jgi:hypothetical protein